jgi:hypothetical protein
MEFLMIEITRGCEEWTVRMSFEVLFERSSLARDHAGRLELGRKIAFAFANAVRSCSSGERTVRGPNGCPFADVTIERISIEAVNTVVHDMNGFVIDLSPRTLTHSFMSLLTMLHCHFLDILGSSYFSSSSSLS